MRRYVSGGVVFVFALSLLVVALVTGRPEIDTAGASDGPYRIHGAGTGRVVEVTLDAVETEQEIAEGVKYHVWTFGGAAPGPVIRVKLGDTVRFTLTNKSSVGLAHSIDFHAAQTPWDRNYQPVQPGETLTFDWVARFPGVFMYHCGVPPVLHHIANGMYGAIIVEPEDGLALAREYVLVSSEFYAGEQPVDGRFEGDVAQMLAAAPTHVVFNGRANRYLDSPLVAMPDELIRLWVLNAGPTLRNDFHVIGALFDHVYPDGNPTNQLNGIQTWSVPAGGGAMFELSIPDEGMYPFVNHSFAYTGLGAVGVIDVSAEAPASPTSYPAVADAASGGLQQARGTVEGDAAPPPAPGPSRTPDTGNHEGTALALEMANVAFIPTSLEGREGEIAVAIVNKDGFGHDFTIDALGAKFVLGANETGTFTLQAGPGTYEFYCSVPGHREAGMVGTLRVLPAAGH